jgi:hypothetical protein
MNTIKRVRKFKKRFGLTNGPVFLGLHFGRHSWYVQKPTPRRKLWSIRTISDNEGIVELS